jgi:hypothetical protein
MALERCMMIAVSQVLRATRIVHAVECRIVRVIFAVAEARPQARA